MPDEHLPKKSSMENYKWEKVGDTRKSLRLPSGISKYQQSNGNNLYRTQKRGVASKDKEQMNMKTRESEKLSGNMLSEKPEQRHH